MKTEECTGEKLMKNLLTIRQANISWLLWLIMEFTECNNGGHWTVKTEEFTDK